MTTVAEAEVVQATVKRETSWGPAGRRAVRMGLIGGIVAIYLCMVGMVERFDRTNVITGVLTLGLTFLYLTMLVTGYLAARNRRILGISVPLPGAQRVVSGVVAGLVAGAMLGGFILFFNAFDFRHIFVALSPLLLESILTFDQEPLVGAAIWLVLGSGLGLVGAALHFMRARDRTVVVAGALTVLLVGVMEQLIRVVLTNLQLETSWLYTVGGLTVSGAIIMFVVGAGLAFLVTRREALMARATRGRGGGDGGPGAPATPQDNLALGFGLGSLALAVALGVVQLSLGEDVDLYPAPSLLLVSLFVGIGAILYCAVVVRRRTGGRGPGGGKPGRAGIGFFAAVAGIFIIVPPVVGEFLSQAMVIVMIYILLGLGLNIVVGYAGLLDLGYVAFFAVGAYTTGLLTSPLSSLVTEGVGEFGSGSQVAAESGFTNFWIALPITVVVAVIIGVLIGAPVLRLRGDYLAIVTLGFGEIVRVIVRSDWAAGFLGGSQGIKAIPPPPPEAIDFFNPQNLFYLILIFSLLAAFVSWRLQFSRVGRAWAAMREDEDVAEAMGISVIKYKLLAFAMGAAVGCLSGAFFAVNLSVVTPDSFELLVSITVLAAIILGGLGSIPGVVVGSVFLVGLPEILRDFAEYRLLLYGAILVAIMIFRPEGLVPSARRRRELREQEVEEVQYERRTGDGGPEPAVTATTGEARTPSSEIDREVT
jgi:ABC-type branched-subunit amino acid transport system permease subunit